MCGKAETNWEFSPSPGPPRSQEVFPRTQFSFVQGSRRPSLNFSALAVERILPGEIKGIS